MIDPLLSLAISMYANKGVYALLLGSGVSRSSGIPTGWEIVQDLIKKIACLRGEPCDPDPDTWFRTTFQLEPDYSEVLNQVAKSSSERGQVLRSYFEPTEEERSQNLKQPTAGHRAIAALVAKNYVRVIVTTNFDRLLEQALSDVGIQATVIGSPDACQGSLPLAHSLCTIIKVNGDYLDTRLKNTRDELEKYDPPIERLLDQVFDEYGLVVAGWSGDWDTALLGAIARAPNRRFTTFWTYRSELGPKAKELSALRQAALIQISDADSFFQELSEKLDALDRFSMNDALSAKVAVARLKKYLSDDSNKIGVHDLFSAETERVKKTISEVILSARGFGAQVTGEAILERIRKYESELEVLSQLAICGAYWSTSKQWVPMLRSFKRITDQYEPAGGTVVWLNLRRYPSLLMMYAMGLGALANSNYPFLKALLYEEIRTENKEEGAASVVYDQRVLARDYQKLLPGKQQDHTPLSNHLFEVLREPLRDYLPDDHAYDMAFDLFEYLLGLTYCDLKYQDKVSQSDLINPEFKLWGPAGRYGWKYVQGGIVERTMISSNGEIPREIVGVLNAGFFNSNGKTSPDRYVWLKKGFDNLIERVRSEWGVYF